MLLEVENNAAPVRELDIDVHWAKHNPVGFHFAEYMIAGVEVSISAFHVSPRQDLLWGNYKVEHVVRKDGYDRMNRLELE
ncbi:hypothetical protein GQ600_25588 [Phytophthora cactorum]|nr:hypothetical protein GQ600_25588 [Phytophthora cactorum]